MLTMRMTKLEIVTLLVWRMGLAHGGDPSTTWEAFAVYVPVLAGNVTLISTTYTVPAKPSADNGSTPKWWVGMQSADGNGVLMKPQLTWQNSSWVINTEVLDYSLSPSVKIVSAALTVAPGDVLGSMARILGQNRSPPRKSSYFLLKWGVQIPYLLYENQTSRSDSAKSVPK